MSILKEKKSDYYKLDPIDIVADLYLSKSDSRLTKIKDIEIFCLEHVYPSDQFRTTNFLLETIKPFLKNKSFCDMGCGPGIIGLFALYNGATRTVQADINLYAVKNAEVNKKYHEFLDKKLTVHQSNCFDAVPQEKFDLIVFNPPFHSDEINISDPLQWAFFDPNFRTIQKFLEQASDYSHKETKIFIAFSNKGDTKTLEKIFGESKFNWKLFKQKNQRKKFDNRIYLLQPKQ